MTWLLEDPTMVIAAGVVLEGIVVASFVQSGRGALLWLAIGIPLIVALLVGVEWMVVTDAETIEAMIDDAAQAIEDEDLTTLLHYIAPEATQMRDDAHRTLGRADVSEVKIRNLEVALHGRGAQTATAPMRITITGEDRTGQMPYETFSRRFTLQLRREGDRWLMTGYTVVDPAADLR